MPERTWQDDPCVQFEDTILEALSNIQRLVVDTIGTSGSSSFDFLQPASKMLQFRALRNLRKAEVEIPECLATDLQLASDAFDDLLTGLKTALATGLDLEKAQQLMAQLCDVTRPAILIAIATYRDIYIGAEIAEQEAYAKQSHDAIATLEKVSKQIFFISINASVEAARVGDIGKGFTQISSDIRALSHSAQTATQGLSSLVKSNAA